MRRTQTIFPKGQPPWIEMPETSCIKVETESRVRRRARATKAVWFFNVLTCPAFLETTEALLPEHREHLYPPTVALSMFMLQTREADGACQKVVNGWAVQRASDGLSPGRVRTGGYCRALQRLPLEMVSRLARQTARIPH